MNNIAEQIATAKWMIYQTERDMHELNLSGFGMNNLREIKAEWEEELRKLEAQL